MSDDDEVFPCPQCGDPCTEVRESFPGQHYCAKGHGWGLVSEHVSIGNITAANATCPTCQALALTVWWKKEEARHFKCPSDHSWSVPQKKHKKKPAK